RAFAHDDEWNGQCRVARLVVDGSADHDAAAVAYQAIAAALRIDRSHSAGGHVQHGGFADPERAAIIGGIGVLASRTTATGHAALTQFDAPAPAVEGAVHGDLAAALQNDRLARVHVDLGAPP